MTSEDELDALQRGAEQRLYAHYGLSYTERFVSALGTSIRVVDIAGDPAKRPVLLLHGIASVTAAAIPLIPAFDGAPVIAVDWPGHGLSGPFPFAKGTDLREFTTAILDAVLEQTAGAVDVVAHSLGGQFALYYCLARPERVHRLVLLGAPGGAFAELRPPASMRFLALPGFGARMLGTVVPFEQYKANSAITLGAGTVDPWPIELVEVGWYASQRRAFAESLPGLFRTIASVFGVRRSAVIRHEDLATITIPVLLVWGTDDVFLSPERARPSWTRMPHAELVELEANHAPWLNQPEQAAAAVHAFLAD
ncbi:pimeloyl-ACP methyl ester carboxylesterase [Microbacteriaceae bacterium SG_E_30_P1]|uniref:Pimeloyl-ACP methyl ester carboxylesterase n=1 Tax=Antiquaquibacter oligotrophicus TaxID=2880260 RepID=A0ABT6KJD1_9MICO|nr:alpha/beta hydrolase [Antiquaquibacter oligotrophicus]MDH6180097.1 pimeloyl-ACP methyl ester carboxylesterase [Antiquaquibacter oligotrophicus]UDF14152.1 alpha/beta hydrolase [Antiquaquibacter oligotrophicus]